MIKAAVMKMVLFLVFTSCFLASCNESSTSIERKVDSFGSKAEEKLEQGLDSLKEGYKDVRDKADSAIDARRENRDTTN